MRTATIVPDSSITSLNLDYKLSSPKILFPATRPVSISEIGKSQDYQTVGVSHRQKSLDFNGATLMHSAKELKHNIHGPGVESTAENKTLRLQSGHRQWRLGNFELM